MTNLFKTNEVDRANIAKQELLITAVQDYREDLVKVNAKLNGYQEAELFADRSYLLDIGIPSTFTVEQAALYSILNASMQYKFWTIDENGYHRYAKDGKSGAVLMTELLNKTLIPIIADFENSITTFTESQLYALDFFPPANNITRSHIVGSFLRMKVNTDAIFDLATAVRFENRVTIHMAKRLANRFPHMFADPYLKKAQLALFMLASWINLNKKTDYQVDISNLTMFADYQVPRVMQQLGLLIYHPCVYKAIGMYIEFPSDSPVEKALRAATILAGEEIANKYMVPAAVVDNWLWTKRNECTYPHHLTNTSRY